MRKNLLRLLIAIALMALLAPAAHAAGPRVRHDTILIYGDDDFVPQQGVRSGSGTASDPFVISGWQTDGMLIRNTGAHIRIVDNEIGLLILNWNGYGRVEVVDNTIGDLRVNENVRRTGGPTSGVISGNQIRSVSQLRHWDGVFEENIVGVPIAALPYCVPYCVSTGSPVMNLDGFNGGVIRNNTFYGYVRAQLHGHHHSSGFEAGSHDHTTRSMSPTMESVDHHERYHRVSIVGNTVYSTGNYGIAYFDTDHAQNDVTASSETNPALREAHVHHTQLEISGNELFGSGILVNTFNAVDQRHESLATGTITIVDNEIKLLPPDLPQIRSRAIQGIFLKRVGHADVTVTGNSMTGSDVDSGVNEGRTRWDFGGGIVLSEIDNATVRVETNRVINRPYGVRARLMPETVTWTIAWLTTVNVNQPVYWDETVENSPELSGGGSGS